MFSPIQKLAEYVCAVCGVCVCIRGDMAANKSVTENMCMARTFFDCA